MAVTIVRTPWVDDDGSGSTGTVINNAVKTALYNDIDGALAKVAQLAGGNTFTGNQIISTQLTINTANAVGNAWMSLVSDGAVKPGFAVGNTNPANSMNFVAFFNSASAFIGSVGQNGANAVVYNTSSDQRLKTDAGRATDVAALRAVVVHDFAWTADGARARGVFAQEAHAVFPAAITVGTDETTADGSLARPWMTDYSKFVPDLIVGWQQHDAELAELRALLATVKG